MKKSTTSTRRKLEEILDSKDFSSLEPFRDSASWKRMRKQDKELLGQLFVMCGEKQLESSDGGALKSFEAARKLAPDSLELWLRQAEALANQQESGRCVATALEIVEGAAAIDSQDPRPLILWGETLAEAGELDGRMQWLQEACEKFDAAQDLLEEGDERLKQLYHKKGATYCTLGTLSGEACDIRTAITYFEKAEAEGLDQADFWVQYGNAVTKMSYLIGRQELLIDAIAHYDRAVGLQPEMVEGWLKLGDAAFSLYKSSGADQDFARAYSAYQTVLKHQADHEEALRSWATLLIQAGRLQQQPELLDMAIEKLEAAAEFDSDNPQTWRLRGEAFMVWGAMTDRLDLLRNAEDAIQECLQIEPEDPYGWYLRGSVLAEMGRYFEDEQYYSKAIEAHQTGVSLEPNFQRGWYGLALVHFRLGELKGDLKLVEKSIKYCEKLMEVGGQNEPRYWNEWGVALFRLAEMTGSKKYAQQAIHKFEEAMERRSTAEVELGWLYNYGCVLDFYGDFTDDEKSYEKAVQVLEEVVAVGEEGEFALYNLGLALSHLGEVTADSEVFEKAIDCFEQLSELDEEDDLLYHDWGLAILNQAQLLEDPHSPEQAQRLREQAEEKLMHAVAKGNVHAFYTLACLYSIAGHIELSLSYIKRAVHADALPPIDDLMNDEWLEQVRDSEEFKEYISQFL